MKQIPNNKLQQITGAIKKTRMVLAVLFLNCFMIQNVYSTDHQIPKGTPLSTIQATIDAMGAGEKLLFERGGTWTFSESDGSLNFDKKGGIEIASYGDLLQPRPKFIGPAANSNSFICINITEAGSNWIIHDIDFDKAYMGIKIDIITSQSYFQIYNIKCTNMTFSSITDAMGTGICLENSGYDKTNYGRYSNVDIHDIETDNTFRSVSLWYINNIKLNRIKGFNGGHGVFNLHYCSGGSVSNCTAYNFGGSRENGTTGGYLFHCTGGMTISNCEFAFTYRGDAGTADGCALDFEGENNGVIIDNCLFHDNDGTGIMFNAPFNQNSQVNNSIFINNAKSAHVNNIPCGHLIESPDETVANSGTLASNRFYTSSYCPRYGKGNIGSTFIHSGVNRDLNINTSINGTNHATSAISINALSVYNGQLAANVIDRRTDTYWIANGLNDQWIQIDLGTEKDINKFIIRQLNDNIKRFAIQYTNTPADPNSWLDCWNGKDMELIQYCPTWKITARYYRIYIYDTNNSNNPAISEIELYYNTPVAEQNLYAHYMLDGDGKDAVGVNNGIITDGSFIPDNKKSGSHSLKLTNGSSPVQMMNVPLSAFSGITNDFTISFWAKPDKMINIPANTATTGITGTSGQNYAIFPDCYGGSTDAGTGVSVGNNGVAVFEHADNHLPALLKYEFSNSQWMFITVVYKNKIPYLYIDGMQKAVGLQSTKNVHPSAKISSWNSTIDYGPYSGHIDDIRIYNNSLTDEQVKNLFRSYSIPVARFRFEESLGQTNGICSYSYNGSASANYVAGHEGRAINIDNSSYASFSKSDPLIPNTTTSLSSIKNNFAISFWVKPNQAIDGLDLLAVNNSGAAGTLKQQKYAIHPDYYIGEDDAAAGVSVGTNGVAVFELMSGHMPALVKNILPISPSDWSLVTLVYNDKKPSIYINGGNKASNFTSQKKYVHPSLNIGDDYYHLGYGRYSGAIDDIRLYDVSLNDAEVANLFSHQSVPKQNGDDEKNGIIPKEFSLSQNYPNPFNPSTVINYALPEAAHVSLKVYDVLGKEVRTLVYEYKTEGRYSVQFNAAGLPSGIYVYQLKAGNIIVSRKMMLVK